ncbi:hypothetical protein MACK_001402 [Theileria orientalis]|uniref:Ubiquinol-cytochrome c chaperone domain-containing protein n=1 Tax=Theileria orientalis TaxID=68886 RepID=A0A976MCZ4_THEOR|nr:hypothetical protein MACK_001402 [Theileria orientalis]
MLSHKFFYSTNSIKLKQESQPSEPEPKDSQPLEPSEHPLNFFDTYSLTFDPEKALEYSNHILDDPISDITVQESSKFLIPFPNPDPPTLFETLTKPFGDGYLYEPASTMVHLCVERLENEELTKVFDIGEGFNKRAYFLTLHIWLLYRRIEREIPEGVLLNRYLLKIFYKLIKDWLGLRQTPEFRFRGEFENTQNHMVKFIAELQKCTEDGELYPYKLSVCFKKVMYDDDVSDEVVDLLVKYTIRQFMHLHNIDTNHLMNAMFLWGDTEEICKPARLLKRPMMQLIKYGGYRVAKVDQIEGSDTKKLK